MKSITIAAYNNDNKQFHVAYQPGCVLLPIVNQKCSDPRREGIPFICQKGACRGCVVEVLEGAELLEPPSRLEQRALQVGKTTIDKGFRLACITQFKDEL